MLDALVFITHDVVTLPFPLRCFVLPLLSLLVRMTDATLEKLTTNIEYTIHSTDFPTR